MTVESSSTPPCYFGQGIKRREDPKYLTGQSRSTDDLTPPGTLYAAIGRSLYAHARILPIDVEVARKMPGVIAVYTEADLRDRVAALPCTWILPGTKVPSHPVLASDFLAVAGSPRLWRYGIARRLTRDRSDDLEGVSGQEMYQ